MQDTFSANIKRVIILALLFTTVGALFVLQPVRAESLEEVRTRIEEHNKKIQAIEKEISQYQKELNEVATQKQTLQSTIKTLDVSRTQTASKISATQRKIDAANLALQELSYEISNTEDVISLNRATLAESIRARAMVKDSSLVEQLLASVDLKEAWQAIDEKMQVEAKLAERTNLLRGTKELLSTQKVSVDKTKQNLSGQKKELATQKTVLDITKKEKENLLSVTKNQELTYQELIAKKRAEQKAFEAELSSLEDTLQTIIDPTKIPKQGTGVLAWPFSSTFMANCVAKKGVLGNEFCITQYFGNTPFSTKNPQVYNGSGHNAIDFGAPSGTPLLATLSGTVMDTGNTDLIRGCYSFGKWVLLKHGNGLTSLYAHLSSTSVAPGQSLATGDIIGYSGMTGYATGPHLHYGLYASEGLKVMTLSQYRGATSPCANARMPVAPKNAYLNPLSYF